MIRSFDKKRARWSRLRGAIDFVICLVAAVLLVRTWQVEAYVVPTGSMADALVGVHRRIACADCGFEFACGMNLPPAGPLAVCPNCDFAENDVSDVASAGGDRLLVDKSAFTFGAPRRWEIVVFRSPLDAHEAFIKRVIGLPGECIEIRGGDVYAGGKIVRKTLAQQRAMALVVHDSRFTPGRATDNLPPRWRGDSSQSRWTQSGGRFVHPPDPASRDAKASPTTDWLSYRHWRRVPGLRSQAEEVPITDRYGYNQSVPRRAEDVHPVSDVMLSCRVRTWGKGTLSLYASDGREQFIARLDPEDGSAELLHNNRTVRRARLDHPLLSKPSEVELSLVDRQFLLAVDGSLLLEPYPYEPSDLPYQPTSRPLAIGAEGLGVEADHLRVLRDVYYTRLRGPGVAWGSGEPVCLSPNEYFVLGDNSPLSQDSRAWAQGPGVPESLLVGRPLVVHLPSRSMSFRGLRLQVPDFARIRPLR